jgi:hypothetical protein
VRPQGLAHHRQEDLFAEAAGTEGDADRDGDQPAESLINEIFKHQPNLEAELSSPAR